MSSVFAERAPLSPWAAAVYRPSLRRWRVHPVLKELRCLEDEQWLSRDACTERHVARLATTVQDALTRVPYYRDRLRETAGVETAMRFPEDLALLPLLDREALLYHRGALTADGADGDDAAWNQTGGSSGQPVSFLQDDEYRAMNLAATARHDRWAGWRFGARTALLWGANRDLATAQGWRDRLATRWLRRQIELDAFELSEKRLAAFTHRQLFFHPQVIRGYAAALDMWAVYLEQHGRHFPPPRGVISCAETLESAARERIERVFAAKVFDRYGCRELGLIASQCELGSYHVNTRGVWVEILDGDRPAAAGTTGRVVVTGLACGVMPLLRYETGDIAVSPGNTDCSCGRGLPLLGEIRGRSSEFVITADERRIHGEYFTHLFYRTRHVERFTVVQDGSGAVLISVVGDGAGLADEMDEVLRAVRERVGTGTEVTCRHVEVLAPPSGKRCFVRSELARRAWRGERLRPESTT